jgi:phosphoheptose isomerase
MSKKLLVLLMILAVVATFGLSTLAKAEETIIKAKVEAVNKEEKKIVLSGKEYSLTDEAAQTQVDVDDEVEVTVDNEVVKDINK